MVLECKGAIAINPGAEVKKKRRNFLE